MISKEPIKNFNKKFDVVSVFLEHDGKILLLHRQDHKPQGNTWGVPAGKADPGEELIDALVREVNEEIGLHTMHKDYIFCESYHVRYSDFDFLYHIYRLVVKKKPIIDLNNKEHKDYKWIHPKEALKLDLIQDEDMCIKWTYLLN